MSVYHTTTDRSYVHPYTVSITMNDLRLYSLSQLVLWLRTGKCHEARSIDSVTQNVSINWMLIKST